MRLRLALISSFAWFLTACGGLPVDRNEQAAYYANEAKVLFAQQRSRDGGTYLQTALARPNGPEKVRKLFNDFPETKSAYLQYLQSEVSTIESAQQARERKKHIQAAIDAQLFLPSESAKLSADLSRRIKAGNEQGSIPFFIEAGLLEFPELNTPEQMNIIFARSLDGYRNNMIGRRDIGALVEFAQRGGENSHDALVLEAQLPKMNIRAKEIAILAPYYPEFAA